MVVVSGSTHHQADVLHDGANGDHTRGTSTWLTGVHPKHTEGADVLNGISADQIAAGVLGKDTPLPSLELGIDLNHLAGNCENGYSCVYMNTLSWSSPTTPLPTENNPRIVFERLFGDGGTSAAAPGAGAREPEHSRCGHRASWAGCSRRSGPADRATVDHYVELGPRNRAADSERRESTARRPCCRRSIVRWGFPSDSTSTST